MMKGRPTQVGALCRRHKWTPSATCFHLCAVSVPSLTTAVGSASAGTYLKHGDIQPGRLLFPLLVAGERCWDTHCCPPPPTTAIRSADASPGTHLTHSDVPSREISLPLLLADERCWDMQCDSPSCLKRCWGSVWQSDNELQLQNHRLQAPPIPRFLANNASPVGRSARVGRGTWQSLDCFEWTPSKNSNPNHPHPPFIPNDTISYSYMKVLLLLFLFLY